ncbi:MAG: hypothetical protein EBW85_05480 [Burkholderiaceae bacterium]|nr:hypothetical protein [Burkholderiaceae bacterium]
MNPGGIRTDLVCRGTPPCDVTYGDLFSMQPFGNSLVVMSLTGAEIRQLLEQQQRSGPDWPLMSPSEGLNYRWSRKAPVGQRAQDIRVQGQPLDESATYRVTVNSFMAEGGDGSGMTRTMSMEMALDDVMVAWAMNGEMLRPENGFPIRLVVPGVQGVSWVKWLRRIEVGDMPYATKDEAIHYIDLMPDGLHRQYTSIQECKSVITTPSGGQQLFDKGYYNVSGLAWSGRGKIKRVDVSFDGGNNWRTARLETPILTKALTRFNIDWVWDGSPTIMQSRAIDDTGYVQPTIRQLRAVRGTRSIYHNNAIQSWKVDTNGEVSNVQVG